MWSKFLSSSSWIQLSQTSVVTLNSPPCMALLCGVRAPYSLLRSLLSSPHRTLQWFSKLLGLRNPGIKIAEAPREL